MEVNIALLIMAVGLLGLFSLFPVGLRQSDAAASDTAQAAFADLVLNAMRANSQMITNWGGAGGWLTTTNGVALGVAASSPADRKITVPTASGGTVDIIGDGGEHEIGVSSADGYLIPDRYLKYNLHIENGPAGDNDLTRKAWIQVTDRRFTSLTNAPVYATAFVYMGM